MSGERPNFLVVMTDQHRADHLGCYGNTTVRTPAIDTLAARGWLFENCHVAAPMCMSNRASFMTMRMPSLHGVRHNGIPLPRSERTFVEVLRAAGYATGLIGKSHLQNMDDHEPLLKRHLDDGRAAMDGLDEARCEDLHTSWYDQERPSAWRDPAHRVATPYYGFDHVELANDHGDLVFGDYARWLHERDSRVAISRGKDAALPAGTIAAPQAWRTAVPAELYPSSYIGERAIAYLEQHARRRRAAQPFFLMCSFPDPHHPFTPPGKYWEMYDPADIEPPTTLSHDRTRMTPRLGWLHDERAAGKAPLHSHRTFVVTEKEARQAIALTYGMISLVDDTVGHIVAALDRLGLADNTVIVFTSDHGDFMGDHGLLLKGPLHYRGLIRVPLIWHDPGRRDSRRIAAFASTIDIGETILHRAALAAPNGAQGRSLNDVMDAGHTSTRDAILIEDETQRAFLGFSQPIRVRTLVTVDGRISVYSEGHEGELYDLAADPDETVDIWNEPRAHVLKAALLERMAREMLELTDRSPLPTGLA